MRARSLLAAIAVVIAADGAREASAATFELVSVATGGARANGASNAPAMSADARFIAFESLASNLVAGDTNGASDVFVHDRVTGITTRESVGGSGQGNAGSYAPSISADGRFVAFYSYATNLVATSVTGTFSQVYVRDRLLGVTILVSASSAGQPADALSASPSLSADGRVVAFYSYGSNLVPGDTNGSADIFTRDLSSGAMARESVASNGAQATGSSFDPSLSSDGRFLVFSSTAPNLAPGDTDTLPDIFVRDRSTAQTTLESVGTDGAHLSAAGPPSMSADGRFVAFFRQGPQVEEVYLRDRQARDTTLVTADSRVNDTKVALTRDGRFLIFSLARTLTAYGRLDGSFTAVVPGSFPSAAVTALAFLTAAALVPSDTNGLTDVYVFGDPIISGPPGPPTNLTASSSGSTVTLSWSAPQTGSPATSFIIEAGSSPGASNLANVDTGSAATTFSASGVAAGTYYVRVRAANSAGTSAPSSEAVLVVASICPAPSAPGNLSAVVSGSSVTLTWAAGNGATSYLLLVGSASGRSDLLVSDLRSAATRLDAANVAAGTYFIRVQAVNGCGQSAASNEVVAAIR